MNRQDKQPRSRTYRSPLREEQAGKTRERILAAFAEQISDTSLSDFSIELVARRAGVSVRTVYHHFPNREAIVAGLRAWTEATIGSANLDFPDSLEALGERVEEVFRFFDDTEALIRAQLMTNIGREVRSLDRERRKAMLEAQVAAIPGLDEERQRQAAGVIHHLVNSEAWRLMKDEFSMDGAQAGRAVAWALGLIVDELKRESAQAAGTSGAETSAEDDSGN